MDHLLVTVLTAVGMFAGTNVDDIVMLTVLFLTSRLGGRPRPWEVVAGQYAGIAVLVAASVVAALGLVVVADQWVGLLGLVPLGLGLRRLIEAVRTPAGDTSPVVVAGLAGVTGVTVANGGDNIAAYTSLFHGLGVADSAVTVAVFAVLVGVWCAAGARFAGDQRVAAVVERSGHWLVPVAFMAIGAVIVVRSGLIGRLAGLR